MGSGLTTENMTTFITDDLGNITPEKWHAVRLISDHAPVSSCPLA
jgi:hypothetical protein